MDITGYETIEHKVLTKLFKSDKYLTSRYSPDDLFFDDGKRVIIGEFKSRSMSHTRFDWILEEDKMRNLLKKAKASNKKVKMLYINYFSDDHLVIWNLNDILRNKKYTKTKKLMNKHTADGFKYQNEKVLKNVYLLKIKNAIYNKKLSI